MISLQSVVLLLLVASTGRLSFGSYRQVGAVLGTFVLFTTMSSSMSQPISWNEWQQLPETVERLRGSRASAAERHSAEAALWRKTMAELFGEDWRDLRDTADRDRISDEEAFSPLDMDRAIDEPLGDVGDRSALIPDSLDGVSGTTIAGATVAAIADHPAGAAGLFGPSTPVPINSPRGSQASMASSWADKTSEELYADLGRSYDASIESMSAYKARLHKAVALLERRGQAVDMHAVETRICEKRYCCRKCRVLILLVVRLISGAFLHRNYLLLVRPPNFELRLFVVYWLHLCLA